MSHSEKNEPILPIRGPELESEMAANIGLIGPNLVERTAGCGQAGGESGIRTHGTVSRTHAFQACALSHSAISPDGLS
jgi:hypothetical protein